jgi:tripartite ATP-independent transporter DctP family solute receptor
MFSPRNFFSATGDAADFATIRAIVISKRRQSMKLGKPNCYLAAALVGAGVVLASAGAAVAQDLTLRFALITPQTFPYMDGANKFKELIESRSAGKIKVNIYPGGQLGAEREINEAILEGSIQIGVGAGAMANLAPIYNIVQVPFLVQGQKHMTAIATGDVGKKLAKKIEDEAGFRVLAWFSTGDSPIETVKNPVRKPADLEGVKIRVIETPVLVDAMKALGADPTPMPYTEVYTGLKQGVIDGAHLDVLSVDSLKVYEVAKFMTDWQQITFLSEPRPVIMSAKYFDGLKPDQQNLIRDAMQEAAQYERQVFIDKMTTIRGKFVKEGVQITKVDADAFVEKVKPVWNKYAERLHAEDLLQDIIALKKNE